MSDDSAKRISALVEKSGLPVRELGRRIGVSNVSIGKWMRGAFQPSGKALDAFCEFFGVSPAFVLYGEGSSPEDQEFDPDSISIPLYNVSASCGGGGLVDYPVEILKNIRVSKEFLRRYAPTANPKALHMIPVSGDSMSPTIEDGDSVIVDTSDTYARSDGLYVVQMNESLFVKRIQILPSGIRIISDNPHYPPIEVGEQDTLVIIGKCYAGALIRSLL